MLDEIYRMDGNGPGFKILLLIPRMILLMAPLAQT